jgi:hypothetical protein
MPRASREFPALNDNREPPKCFNSGKELIFRDPRNFSVCEPSTSIRGDLGATRTWVRPDRRDSADPQNAKT